MESLKTWLMEAGSRDRGESSLVFLGLGSKAMVECPGVNNEFRAGWNAMG